MAVFMCLGNYSKIYKDRDLYGSMWSSASDLSEFWAAYRRFLDQKESITDASPCSEER